MVENGIQWSKRAVKQLRKLPPADARKVYEATESLKALKRPESVTNTHTDVQIINQDGKPAFAVLPYDQYLALKNQHDDAGVYIPHEVVGLCVQKGLSLLAAWRTFNGMSQGELAARMGVSQPAVAQMEKAGSRLQKRTLVKAASALGVRPEQLIE